MSHLQDIVAGFPGWAPYALALISGLLPHALLLLQRRGFGRRGFGRRGPRGLFRAFRLLLFASFLGPLLVLAIIGVLVFAFLSGRRGR